MKNTIKYIPMLAALALCSCGDKKSSPQETESTVSIKTILKPKVNEVSAELMTKLPSYLDVAPAVYEIPESLVGSDLFPVQVSWKLTAKSDLYSYVSQFSELPNKPIVVEKRYSKGETVNTLTGRYVVASDQAGGYRIQDFRADNTIEGLGKEDVSALDVIGKNTIIKGSDEHLAASKQAAEVKEVKEAKMKAERLAAKMKAEEAIRLKKEALLAHIAKGEKFKGTLTYVEDKERERDTTIIIDEISEKAGETFVTVTLTQSYNEISRSAKYKGFFDRAGELTLSNVLPGKDLYAWSIVDKKHYKIQLFVGDHKDKLKVTAKDIEGILIRE